MIKKRAKLLSQEKVYTDKLLEGKSVSQASKEVGIGRASKVVDTLNRIEIETRTRAEIKISKKEEIDDEGER